MAEGGRTRGTTRGSPGKGAPVPPVPVVPGSDFGPYYVQARIGSGGYGEVFLAVHRVLRRRAALKIIHPRLAGNRDAVESFLREARIIARFDHPNVVSVYDAGRGPGGHLFMAMKYVPGGSLHELIERERPVPEARAVRLMRDCCAGLAALHGLGIVHRDLKPGNILLEEDGRACLTDFGLAGFHRERIRGVDDENAVGGTVPYLAPEQLTGREIATPRTDLYALGITFTALLTGTVPLQDLGEEEAIRRTVEGRLPDPKALRPDLPEDLRELLREMTDRDPARRPADAAAVLARLEERLARMEGRRAYLPAAGRSDPAQVAEEAERLRADPLVRSILEAYPGPALVLDSRRQIVAANTEAASLPGSPGLPEMLGRRPGEALQCQDARRGPDGCGSGPACVFCSLGRALSEVRQGGPLPARGEFCLRRPGMRGGAVEYAFRLAALPRSDGDGHPLLLFTLRDISAEKRRDVFERHLVESLLDAAETLGVAGGRPPEAGRALAEEALFHQHLLAAEAGELEPLWEDVDLRRLLRESGARLLRLRAAAGRKIVVRDRKGLRVRTDRILLERAVRNLGKNALEACPPGGTVALEGLPARGGVEIRVRNPGVMAPAVREQVFRRSFSTRAAGGRGVGLHAARLFVEDYLGGRIGFSSGESQGTTFWIRLPLRPPALRTDAPGGKAPRP